MSELHSSNYTSVSIQVCIEAYKIAYSNEVFIFRFEHTPNQSLEKSNDYMGRDNIILSYKP